MPPLTLHLKYARHIDYFYHTMSQGPITKRIFIKQTLRDELNAGPKAKRDVYTTLQGLGYEPITYISNTSNRLLRYLHGLLLIFKALWIRNSVVLIENPIESWRFVTVATKIMRRNNNHLVLLIHDIESERYHFPRDIEYNYINTFHSVIAHNEKMKAFLSDKISREIQLYTLGIFDYRINNKALQHATDQEREHGVAAPWQVVFCGNLTKIKTEFLYHLTDVNMPNWALNLYGVGIEEHMETSNVKYSGSFNPDEPVVQPNSNFGLIWDGASVDTCTGIWGEYMKMNNPHKLSLYIAINLPIIVWEQAAVASFVLDNGIGFTISKLSDIADKLSALTNSDYQVFLNNLKSINQQVTTGGYLKLALEQVVLL